MQKTLDTELDTEHLHGGKIPYVTTWGLKRGEGICLKGVYFGKLTVSTFISHYNYGQVSIVMMSCIRMCQFTLYTCIVGRHLNCKTAEKRKRKR